MLGHWLFNFRGLIMKLMSATFLATFFVVSGLSQSFAASAEQSSSVEVLFLKPGETVPTATLQDLGAPQDLTASANSTSKILLKPGEQSPKDNSVDQKG
jgi:hypothetical protein